MGSFSGLFSLGFLLINLQFALVIGIAALFFSFSGYLLHMGVSPATSGFILSADALAALIIQPLISPLVHSGTARRWLLGGSFLLSSALFMLGHVTTIPLLVAARLAQGAGFICVLSALNAMIVCFIPPGMSGRAFGWLSLVRLIPYAVIPLLFELLAITPATFGSVLNVAAIIALVPSLALLLPFSRQAEGVGDSRPPGLSGMAASLSSGPVVLLLLSALLFFCGFSIIFFFLKQYGTSLGIANASFFFTIASVVMIAVRLFASRLFDRYNKARFCMAGLLAVAISYALLPLCSTSSMLFALAGIAGLGWGITMPLQAASMFDISAPSARAMNQNLLVAMMQGGFFIGPFVGGLLIDSFGYPVLFITLTAITLVSGMMMSGVKTVVTEE